MKYRIDRPRPVLDAALALEFLEVRQHRTGREGPHLRR